MATKGSAEAVYSGPAVTEFLQLLQEATRARPKGGPQNYIPPNGGEIADADYHHFVFGQRGSGKSSLLRHLEARMVDGDRGSAWIDQEIFANLQYPDVLVSAVHALMHGLHESVERLKEEAPRQVWWRRWLGMQARLPERQRLLTSLASELRAMTVELNKLKFAPIDSKVEWTVAEDSTSSSSLGAGVKVHLVSLDGKLSEEQKRSASTKQVIEGSKEQFLERSLLALRDLITRTSDALGGGFVFVDDLYQIRRDVQPLVLGYLHRLLKDTGLWLKVGSIRYSTITYRQGDPPRGMQVGHDAHEVPLDRGLRHFKTTQAFLEEILAQIATQAGVDIKQLLTEETRKRLILASGGVARDYLRLVSGAIAEARNRGTSTKPGSHRVIVEDVNKAAGSLSPSKFNELREDEPQEAASLEGLVRSLTEFCRSNKRAYFLVPTDNVPLSAQVNKLQHLRFAHLLAESETVPNEGARRFNVWLLDVAELSAQRATQDMDFTQWETREKRRAKALIFNSAQEALSAERVGSAGRVGDQPSLFPVDPFLDQ